MDKLSWEARGFITAVYIASGGFVFILGSIGLVVWLGGWALLLYVPIAILFIWGFSKLEDWTFNERRER